MNSRLEDNDYFEEMVLITPTQYEKFNRWRQDIDREQCGSGMLDSDAMDSSNDHYEGLTTEELIQDENPDIEKKKRTFLMATNDVQALAAFNKTSRLQRNLDNHLLNDTALLRGYNVATLGREIARLKQKYRTEFAEILKGSSRIISTQGEGQRR